MLCVIPSAALGRDMIEHAKIQASRELRFLEHVNCIEKRDQADVEGAQQYYYTSRPDLTQKNIAKQKDLYDFWDR